MTQNRLSAFSPLGAFKGLGWVATATWGVQVIKLLTFAALANFIDPRTFGIFAFFHAVIVVLQPAAGLGLSAAMVIKEKLSATEISSSLVLALLTGVIGIGVLYGVWHLISWYAPVFGNPVLGFLIITILLTNIANVTLALPRRHKRFAVLALVLLVGELVGSAIAIAIAISGDGLVALVTRTLLTGLVLAGAGIAIVAASLGLPSFRAARAMVSHGIAVAGSEILAACRNRGDELLVGALLGAPILGIYVIARRYLDALRSAIPAVIGNHALPVMSSMQGSQAELARHVRQSTALVAALAWPAFLATAILAPLWVHFLLGPEWRGVVVVVHWLAAVAALQATLSICLIGLVSIGKTKRKLQIDVAMVLATFGFMAFGAQWGLRPMLIGTLAGTAIVIPMVAVSIDRLLPITGKQLLSDNWPNLAVCMALAVPLLGALWVSPYIPDEIAMGVGGLCTLAAMLLSLRRVNPAPS